MRKLGQQSNLLTWEKVETRLETLQPDSRVTPLNLCTEGINSAMKEEESIALTMDMVT